MIIQSSCVALLDVTVAEPVYQIGISIRVAPRRTAKPVKRLVLCWCACGPIAARTCGHLSFVVAQPLPCLRLLRHFHLRHTHSVGKAQGRSRMPCTRISRSALMKRPWSTTMRSPKIARRDYLLARTPCALCTLCMPHTSDRRSGHRTTPSNRPGFPQGRHSLRRTRA